MAKPTAKGLHEKGQTRPEVGEPFNPYRLFKNVLIPEAMARSRDLLPAAKIVYGDLRRFAGENGLCFPAVHTLATRVGLGDRQVQNHLRSLERKGFIRKTERFNNRDQTSNSYEFLWHQIFDEQEKSQNEPDGVNSTSPHPRTTVHPAGCTPVRPKEGHIREGHMKEGPSRESSPINFGRLDMWVSADDEKVANDEHKDCEYKVDEHESDESTDD